VPLVAQRPQKERPLYARRRRVFLLISRLSRGDSRVFSWFFERAVRGRRRRASRSTKALNDSVG